jgi:uncharacterized surface anchored protein
VTITGLAPGSYTFTENSTITGYILNTTPISFFVGDSNGDDIVDASDTRILPVVNVAAINLQGTILFTKTMSFGSSITPVPPELVGMDGKPLAGAIFQISNYDPALTSPPPDHFVQTATSDANGQVTFTDLPPDNYWLKELHPPAGFDYVVAGGIYYNSGNPGGYTAAIPATITDPADATIDLDSSGYFGSTLSNLLVNTSVFFQKTDAGGAPLSGAVFELYILDGGDYVPFIPPNPSGNTTPATTTTNSDGFGVGSGLLPGSYRFIEIQAPEGYLINQTPIDFDVTAGETAKVILNNDFVNYTGSATLLKTDKQDNALDGATFWLFDDLGNILQSITTDSTGAATFTDLAPGVYTVQETYAPNGYLINSSVLPSFTIPDAALGAPAVVAINDLDNNDVPDPIINYQASVGFTKANEQGELLQGYSFTLTNLDTSTNVQAPGGQPFFTTDSNGWVQANDLAPGNYAFNEMPPAPGTPYTYIVNSAAINFMIDNSAAGEPQLLTLADFTNYLGTAQLQKKDDSGRALAGAGFDLYFTPTPNAVVGASTTPVKLGSFTSAANGLITVTDLAPGEYYFIETTVPDGYTASTSAKYRFTVVASYPGKPDVIQVSAVNDKLTPLPPTGDQLPLLPIGLAVAGLVFLSISRKTLITTGPRT